MLLIKYSEVIDFLKNEEITKALSYIEELPRVNYGGILYLRKFDIDVVMFDIYLKQYTRKLFNLCEIHDIYDSDVEYFFKINKNRFE